MIKKKNEIIKKDNLRVLQDYCGGMIKIEQQMLLNATNGLRLNYFKGERDAYQDIYIFINILLGK